jgi:hypothetical protein
VLTGVPLLADHVPIRRVLVIYYGHVLVTLARAGQKRRSANRQLDRAAVPVRRWRRRVRRHVGDVCPTKLRPGSDAVRFLAEQPSDGANPPNVAIGGEKADRERGEWRI